MTSPAEPTMPVEYLATARLGEKGQITLPKAYRDAVALDTGAPITVLTDYTTLITLARPEIIPLPDAQAVTRARHLIRHAADVPVLLSAMQSHPDWLLTHNTAHFTPAVAKRTGLQIATSRMFFQALARSLV